MSSIEHTPMRSRCLGFILPILAASLSLRAEEMTVAFSTASQDYLARQGTDAETKQETYIFVKGEFFGGRVVDKGLQTMSFQDLARNLSGFLRKKSYTPARQIDTADLMLVVHWGATIGNDKDHELINKDLERSRDLIVQQAEMLRIENDPPPLPDGEVAGLPTNSSMAIKSQLDFEFAHAATGELGNEIKGQSTSAMLGFTKDLQREARRAMVSEKTKTLMAMMEEDRYFIIVMAYDLARFREDRRLVRLWTSRMSIRSAGVNFATAVQRMGDAGSHIFGTTQPEVRFTKRNKIVREEIVIGDPIVIGTEPPEESGQPKR